MSEIDLKTSPFLTPPLRSDSVENPLKISRDVNY